MTRGLQKEQARARAQAREEGKQGGKSHLKAQQTACNLTCPICRTPISNHKVMVQHYQSKHPNAPPPPESSS